MSSSWGSRPEQDLRHYDNRKDKPVVDVGPLARMRCQFEEYRPSSIPTWPHLRRCWDDAIEILGVDGEDLWLCAFHAAAAKEYNRGKG